MSWFRRQPRMSEEELLTPEVVQQLRAQIAHLRRYNEELQTELGVIQKAIVGIGPYMLEALIQMRRESHEEILNALDNNLTTPGAGPVHP